MPRTIATGVRELGQITMSFGLEMLKQGISENKRIKAMEAFESYREYLETLDIPQDEKVDALEESIHQFKMGEEKATVGVGLEMLKRGETEKGLPMTEEEVIRIPRKEGVGLEVLKGKEEIAPALAKEPVAKGRFADVYAPFAEDLAKINKLIADPRGKKLREAAVGLGIDPMNLVKLEEQARGRITTAGGRAMAVAFKEEEFDIKRMESERKQLYGAERNKVLQEKADFDKLAKSRTWQLGVDTLAWKKSVKKEWSSIRTASDAARKVKEIRASISDAEEKLMWNRKYFEIVEKKRETGRFRAIKDVLHPLTEKKYKAAGNILKERVAHWNDIMDNLIKKFNLTPDTITSKAGFKGTPQEELREKYKY